MNSQSEWIFEYRKLKLYIEACSRNVTCRLICLITCFVVNSAPWESSGVRALLEEVHNFRQTLKFHSLAPLPFLAFLYPLLPCLSLNGGLYHFRNESQNKWLPLLNFFWWRDFYLRNRKVTLGILKHGSGKRDKDVFYLWVTIIDLLLDLNIKWTFNDGPTSYIMTWTAYYDLGAI